MFHRFVRTHPLVAYFSFAYAFSWLMCLPWLAVGPVAFPVVFFIGGMGPCVAAIAVTSLLEGRAGVRKLLAGAWRWRVGLRWWALALLGFPLLAFTAILAGHWLTGEPLAWKPPGSPSGHLPLTMLVLGIPLLALLEEIGWRGYAWPALLKRHRFLMASAILGTLWACWHLPLFLVKGMSHEGLPFIPYLGMAIGISIWLGWLYCHTQSILLAAVFHASLNYSGLLPGSQSLPALATLGGLGLVLTVALVCVSQRSGARMLTHRRILPESGVEQD